MAETTARIAPGPRPDPAAHDQNAGSAEAEDGPSFAAYMEVTGADAARRPADEGASFAEVPSELVGAAAGSSRADAFPSWSFRDGGARTSRLPVSTDRHQVEMPFGSGEHMAAVARAQPMFGPVGRRRAPALVALLAAVTFGTYALEWTRRITRELEDFDPQLRVRPARGVLALAIPWAVGVLATVLGALFVAADRLALHLPFGAHLGGIAADALVGGILAVPYLALVLPFSLVALVMTLERIRCVEEHVGVTSDRQVRPVATTMLLAIPVVGGLLLLSSEQRRLNALWEAVAPTGYALP